MDEKVELTFAEKHPKLNMLLVLILLIVMGVVAFFILKYAVIIITLVAKKVVSEASKTDAVIIVALITGIVSIAGLITGKVIEYWQMKKEYLTKKKEAPYSSFVEMVYKIQQSGKGDYEYTSEEMKEDIYSFSKDLTLWGSKRVVNKWTQFRLAAGKVDNDPTKNLFALEEIMNAMRKDLRVGKTRKGRSLKFFVNDIDQYLQ